jgi:type II secretory pathway component GspD/PulD (secretin)
MKRILLTFTLVGILATCLAGFAQTNSPAADAAASSAPVVATPAPAPEAATPSNAQPDAIIPLIVMDDVPLTDAIRNLARQSGRNYMLDPKIAFGQVGPDGKATPQPSVSIRWENITAEQALTALLDNYTLQLVEDPKSRIARISAKDPAALPPLSTEIIQLKYAGPSNVVVSIQSILSDKRSKVLPDHRTSQLVVVATEPEMVEVIKMIERLDTKTKQVLIEARLLETLVNPTTAKGVDWSGTLKAQNVSYGNGVTSGNIGQNSSQSTSGNTSGNTSRNSGQTSLTTTPGSLVTQPLPGGGTATTTTPSDTTTTDSSGSSALAGSGVSSLAGSGVNSILNSVIGKGGLSVDTAKGFNPATFFLNADGVNLVLSFLNTYAETKVISSPRTVTLDNETATIEVGTLYPVVNTSAGTSQTAGGSQITYSNLTVSLKVTPRISANNYVKLSVSPRVVRLGTRVTSVVGGVANSVDSFNTREIVTSVMIPSGNTLVMGGLIEDSVQLGNTKVPLLGDIPVLGYLFRSDTKSRTKSNMIIFLTPTIVEEEDFQPTKSTFLKSPVPVKDNVEDGDWSAWDSGKPQQWKKKAVPQEPTSGDSPTPSAASTPASNSTQP